MLVFLFSISLMSFTVFKPDKIPKKESKEIIKETKIFPAAVKTEAFSQKTFSEKKEKEKPKISENYNYSSKKSEGAKIEIFINGLEKIPIRFKNLNL